jgi:hypothetical protein
MGRDSLHDLGIANRALLRQMFGALDAQPEQRAYDETIQRV